MFFLLQIYHSWRDNNFFLFFLTKKKLPSYAVVCKTNEFRQLQKKVSCLKHLGMTCVCILHSNFFRFVSSKNKSRLVAQKCLHLYFLTRDDTTRRKRELGNKRKSSRFSYLTIMLECVRKSSLSYRKMNFCMYFFNQKFTIKKVSSFDFWEHTLTSSLAINSVKVLKL